MTDEELQSYVGRLIEVRVGEESIVGKLQAEKVPGAGMRYAMKIPSANIDEGSSYQTIGEASLIDSVHILSESPEMLD